MYLKKGNTSRWCTNLLLSLFRWWRIDVKEFFWYKNPVKTCKIRSSNHNESNISVFFLSLFYLLTSLSTMSNDQKIIFFQPSFVPPSSCSLNLHFTPFFLFLNFHFFLFFWQGKFFSIHFYLFLSSFLITSLQLFLMCTAIIYYLQKRMGHRKWVREQEWEGERARVRREWRRKNYYFSL